MKAKKIVAVAFWMIAAALLAIDGKLFIGFVFIYLGVLLLLVAIVGVLLLTRRYLQWRGEQKIMKMASLLFPPASEIRIFRS